MTLRRFTLHLISDSTGETLDSMAKAAIAQFDHIDPELQLWPMVRSTRQLNRLMSDIARRPGLVFYTVVDEQVRQALVDACDKAGLTHVSVLDPVVTAMGAFLGQEATHKPGRQHEMNARYFDRIEAMHFTMAHDDGQAADELDQADIILVGVSRSSKTPTSIYLANRGYKVANIPFVPDAPMPALLNQKLPNCFVVGLTTSPQRLVEVRTNRLRSFNEKRDTDYIDPDLVKAEVRACRRFCAERGWPVIDVTRRSIEETAAAVVNLYQGHRPLDANGNGQNNDQANDQGNADHGG